MFAGLCWGCHCQWNYIQFKIATLPFSHWVQILQSYQIAMWNEGELLSSPLDVSMLLHIFNSVWRCAYIWPKKKKKGSKPCTKYPHLLCFFCCCDDTGCLENTVHKEKTVEVLKQTWDLAVRIYVMIIDNVHFQLTGKCCELEKQGPKLM